MPNYYEQATYEQERRYREAMYLQQIQSQQNALNPWLAQQLGAGNSHCYGQPKTNKRQKLILLTKPV